MASGGFAGGLANGINNMMNLYVQKKHYEGIDAYRQRLMELQEEKADARLSGGLSQGSRSGKASSEDWDGFDNTLMPIFTTPKVNQAPSQPPVMVNPDFQRMPGFAKGGLATLPPRGYAHGGMIGRNKYPGGLSMSSPRGYADGGVLQIPEDVFKGNAEAAYQAPGLASVSRPQAAPQLSQAEEQLSPRQRIVKEMLFGNLANEPDKLNAIHAAAVMNGVGDKVTPWLEGLYKAKKRGVFDGAMNLLNNNVDGAIDDLKRGGITLEDRPVKVNPDDPNDHRWKINISGTGERIMDIKNMIGSTMDADKFLKWQGDQQENATKARVADSQIRENDARVRVSNAQVGKLGEETKTIRAERGGAAGGLSGPAITKLPAPVATAEWLVQKGVYPDHKSAFNAVKTLNDKSPDAQRQELIKARMQGGLMSLADAAKEVDEFLDQGGSGQGTGVPKVRKFNPKTGRFD